MKKKRSLDQWPSMNWQEGEKMQKQKTANLGTLEWNQKKMRAGMAHI